MNTNCLRNFAVGVGLGCLAPWLALCQSVYEPYTITTIAGKTGVVGSADGTNSAARFNQPLGMAVDGAGNIYVADCFNCTIRKVAPVGTNWVVTTLAGKTGVVGSADGTGSAARFNDPAGVALDSMGNLYVGDINNNTIRKGYRPMALASSGAGLGFSGGTFGFALTGPAGQAVVVEASPDLENWVPFWTNTFMLGPLQFCDTNCASRPQRFYRAHRP